MASVLTPHLGARLHISPLTWLKGLWVVLRRLSLSPVAASLQPLGEVRRSGAEGRGTGSGRSRAGRGRQGVRWLRPQGRRVVARRLAAAGTLAQRRCWGLGWGRRVRDEFGHVGGSGGRGGGRRGGGGSGRGGFVSVLHVEYLLLVFSLLRAENGGSTFNKSHL